MSVQRVCLFIGFVAVIGLVMTIWHYSSQANKHDDPPPQPTLGFRPTPKKRFAKINLIKYIKSKPDSYEFFVKDLNSYLNETLILSGSNKDSKGSCDVDQPLATNDTFCEFDVASATYDLCSEENQYGYSEGSPCFALSLTNTIDWRPVDYDNLEVIPKQIAKHYVKGHVTFTCEGETGFDKEHIGQIKYYPRNGVSFKYFPGVDMIGYVSPFIWVKFLNPEIGSLLNVTCKAWAENIHFEGRVPQGMVTLLMLIDEHPRGKAA